MQQLPDLNFANDVTVLDWLCEFQDPSNDIGVVKQQDVVLAMFAAHGYYPNVNWGEDFNENDRDNCTRWLIDQALNGLQKNGKILQVIHEFADDWRKRFLAAA